MSAYSIVTDIRTLSQLGPAHNQIFHFKKANFRLGGYVTDPDAYFILFCSTPTALQEPLDYKIVQV